MLYYINPPLTYEYLGDSVKTSIFFFSSEVVMQFLPENNGRHYYCVKMEFCLHFSCEKAAKTLKNNEPGMNSQFRIKVIIPFVVEKSISMGTKRILFFHFQFEVVFEHFCGEHLYFQQECNTGHLIRTYAFTAIIHVLRKIRRIKMPEK